MTAESATQEPDPRLALLARGAMVTFWAGEAPERIAIISDDGNRTFAQLDRRR